MSAKILKTANMTSNGISEYIVDTEAEVLMLPTSTRKALGDLEEEFKNTPLPIIGSTCIVGNVSGNISNLKVFMLFSQGWAEI